MYTIYYQLEAVLSEKIKQAHQHRKPSQISAGTFLSKKSKCYQDLQITELSRHSI